MKRYRVQALLESPLTIKRSRQSNRSQGAAGIAGTVLRGGLAQLYLQQHGKADAGFRQLFGEEGHCRFGPLDPAPQVNPRSALSCKRRPGFDPSTDHGVVDGLWYRLGQEWLLTPGGTTLLERQSTLPWTHCQGPRKSAGRCGQPLQPLGSRFRVSRKDAWGCKTPEEERSLNAHVGIDRVTQTAAQAIFYTIDAFKPTAQEQPFCGWIEVDEETLPLLKDLLHQSRPLREVMAQPQPSGPTTEGQVFLGHARTRGYGQVRLILGNAIDRGPDRNSWLAWNHECLDFLRAAPFSQTELDAEQDFFFSLMFPTGAILVDRWLRATLDPHEMLPWLPPMGEWGAPGPVQSFGAGQLRFYTAVTEHELVRGWNAAHGLPKGDDWATTRGAVYAYHFRGPTDDRDQLMNQLETLQTQGIGLRRNEGYGTVVVSDDFHRQFARPAVKPESSEVTP
ncbi:MAG: hypothetical protein KDA84_19235 [Planctomycetaceae bacterium]|nr:hypothetical protein [Planctomycetaceae bacterium]